MWLNWFQRLLHTNSLDMFKRKTRSEGQHDTTEQPFSDNSKNNKRERESTHATNQQKVTSCKTDVFQKNKKTEERTRERRKKRTYKISSRCNSCNVFCESCSSISRTPTQLIRIRLGDVHKIRNGWMTRQARSKAWIARSAVTSWQMKAHNVVSEIIAPRCVKYLSCNLFDWSKTKKIKILFKKFSLREKSTEHTPDKKTKKNKKTDQQRVAKISYVCAPGW